MCGICGFSGDGGRNDIERMTEALYLRGPDAGATLMEPGIALGHRRLSIVDLANGSQPMRDPASGAIIVYNGEVYNHWQLRQELSRLGHVFRTDHSDTETVLHAFVEWGPDCFIKFNGMFSCAIYMPGQKKLWLARDRFGEKPLFYIHNRHGFAFASGMDSLRLWPGFEELIDEGNVQRFFAWNYLPGSRTIYKNCHALPPGSWMSVDLETMKTEITGYWRFTLRPDASLTDSRESELVEELRRLLTQAVKRRFLSDVPLGIFLSGGIDSSAVLAAATRDADPGQLSAYTIGFREESFDESPKARAVANFLHVPDEVDELTESVMRDSIGPVLSRMGEPFGDASLIPTAKLSQFTRRHVKVALSGDGGDELFGGYDPLAAIHPASLYRKFMPGPIHGLLRAIMKNVPSSDKNMSLDFKIRRVLRGLSYPQNMQMPVWMSGLEPEEINQFFEHPLPASELFEDAVNLYEANPGLDDLERALMFFTCIYLPDDILVKSDRASMMFSLETRAVFLDNDIVEFCERLPMRFKYRHGQRKYILKKALEGWLPPEILDQPKKGFGIPLNLWLRSLPSPRGHVPGLKPGVIEQCQAAHQRRAGDYRFFLWDLQSWDHLPQNAL